MSKLLTDDELLDKLCEEPLFSRLGSNEQKAFPAFRKRTLTEPMRRWVRGAAERVGLQVAPSENLFSQLSPERQEEMRRAALRVKLPWEK